MWHKVMAEATTSLLYRELYEEASGLKPKAIACSYWTVLGNWVVGYNVPENLIFSGEISRGFMINGLISRIMVSMLAFWVRDK